MIRVEGIEAAFSRVRSSAERALQGDEAAKDKSFQDIFALNNEIGRLGRERPATMARMKELQSCVNAITVGLKYDREGDVREGLALTERTIMAIREELSSSP
jgi:hypothetical protein